MRDPDIDAWVENHPEDADLLSEAHPRAANVLIRSKLKEDVVLGVGRKYGNPGFSLPGGKADPGETLRSAAVRELREETCLEASNLRLVYVGMCGRFVAATFEAEVSGDMRSPEGVPVEWVRASVLAEPPFGEYNKIVFDKRDVSISYK